MISKISRFSAAYLHERLDYNPITGELRWNERYGDGWLIKRHNSRWAGKVTGHRDLCQNEGYLIVHLDRVCLKGHHIAWKMTYGEDPITDIDHKNRDRYDNRISNIREATDLENARNHGISRNNKSGVTGVWWLQRERKWLAAIGVGYKKIELGRFEDINDAIKARRLAEKEIFGQFAR